MDSLGFGVCLGVLTLVLSGCTEEPPAQQAAIQPSVAAEVDPASLRPPAEVAAPPAPTLVPRPALEPVAKAPARAPGSMSALRSAQPAPVDLQRWLKEGNSLPELQVVMLQELQAQSEPDALEIAIELATAKSSDRLVRANAVALLARSQDPRAGEALAALPEKYQRLAKALRKTQ